MEIAESNSQHVGTVDEVEGERIKLARSESGDNMHHYRPFERIDRIDDNRLS